MSQHYPRSIYLVGFMGSGKSTVGKQLAALLHYDFIDLDEYLQQQEGTTITQLFEEKGEAYFRERESEYLRRFDASKTQVVATGGGTPCFWENMEWMNQQGTTVYLKATPALLANRLRNEQSHRPLLRGKTGQEVFDYISGKLAEREKYYLSAKVITEAASLTGRKLLGVLQQKA
ncbi:MAG: AAA family ATPase [Chitinophagales bacterium]|nr:AAA family ATPase [Chitinophagales bacterium]